MLKLINHNPDTLHSLMELADAMSFPRKKAFEAFVEYVESMKQKHEHEQHGTELIFFQGYMQFYIRAAMTTAGVTDFYISNNVRDDIINIFKTILNES